MKPANLPLQERYTVTSVREGKRGGGRGGGRRGEREGKGRREGRKEGREGEEDWDGGAMPLDDEPPAKLLPYTQGMLLMSTDVITYIVECFLRLSCSLL